MTWTELTFGKHMGKSLPQIMFIDPDWFFWALENNVFAKQKILAREAQLISDRAKCIKPPNDEFPDPVVEYLVHRPTMKFGCFNIVPRDRETHTGGSPAFRLSVIDMSVPRRIAQYDKTGCKSLVSSLKEYLFGGKSTRITKARAEAFFSDASNFQ